MAGDKVKKFSSKKYEPDDDFDFSSEDSIDFGELGSPTESSRKPAESFKEGIKEGFTGHFVDPETYKKAIKDNFPTTYGKVVEGYDDSMSAFSDVYRAAGKAIKPAVKDMKRIAKMSTPVAEKILPKALSERLKKWGEPEKAYGVAEGDMREASIKADLESVFVTRDKEAFQQRTEDNIKEGIKEGVEQIRHTDMLGTLNSIRDATTRVAAYQDSTLVNYQRMSLTTQLRAYALQAEDSQLSRTWMETMRASTEDIKKNTSLPDFVKRHTVEDMKAMSRNRLIGKTLNLVGDNTRFIKDWGAKISVQISKSMNEMVSGFVGGAGMVLDQVETGAEAGLDMNNMAGDMVGGSLAEGTGNRLAAKVVGPLKTSKNPFIVAFRKLGYKLATKKATMKDDLMRKSKAGYGEETLLSKLLAWSLPTEDNQASIQGHTTENLQSPAVFDQQSRRTLNEAIPGYFARVLRELQIIRTGNVNIGLTRFDFSSGKFIGDAELKNKLFKSIISDDAVASKKYSSERLSTLIDKDGTKLSPEAKKALHEQMMKDRAGGMGRTTEDFMDPTKYTGTAAPHAHQLARAFQEYIGKADNEVFKKGQGNTEDQLQKINTLHNTFQDIGKYSQVDAGNIQLLHNAGYGQELEEMGILKGTAIDNDKLMAYLSGEARYNPTGGSINAIGLNGKPMRKAPKGRDSAEAAPTRRANADAAQNGNGMTPYIDPNAGGSGMKDVVDAIRANSSKSATDMMLENVKHIEAISINSNEALWKIAEGAGSGAGGGGKKPRWWNRSVGSLASSGAGMVGRGIGNAMSLGGKVLGQGYRAAKKVGELGTKYIPKGIKGAWGLGSKLVKGAWNTGSSALTGVLKWKKEVADVFFRDEVMPRLTAVGLAAGEYFDAGTKKVITAWKDIKGAVVDKFGEVVLSAKDLLETYVKLPDLKAKWENVKQKGRGVWDTITGILTQKISPMDALRSMGGKLKSMTGSLRNSLNGDFQDVYKLSDLIKPLIKGEDVKAGRCFKTTPEGEPAELLRSVFDINGPIVNSFGSQVISQADITEGLCDKRGNKLKARGGIIKNTISSLKNKVMGGLGSIKGFVTGGLNGATNMLSDLFGATGFNTAARRSTNVLLQIRNLLDDRLAGERIGYSDNQSEFLPETSPGGVKLKGGLRKMKIAVKKFFRRGKKGLEEKGGLKAVMADGLKRIKDAVSGAYNKPRTAGDSDGDGDRDGSYADIIARRKEQAKNGLGRLKNRAMGVGKRLKNAATGPGLFGSMFDTIKGIGSALMEFKGIGKILGGLTKVIGPVMSLLGIGSTIATAGTAVAGTAAVGGAAAAGTAALGAGGAAAAAAGTAAVVGTEAAVVGGAAAAAGGTAAGAGLAAVALPLLVGAVVIGGLGYGIYKSVKILSRTKLTALSKLRILQYGIDYNDEPDRAQTLLDLEEKIYPGLVINGESVTIDSSKIDAKEAAGLFGVDQRNFKELSAFDSWFKRRFLPTFASSVSICKSLTNSNNLSSIEKAKSDVKASYFAKAKVITAEFDLLISPWTSDSGGVFSSKKALPIDTAKLQAGIQKLQTELDADKSSARGGGGIISEANATQLEQSQSVENGYSKQASLNAEKQGSTNAMDSAMREAERANMNGSSGARVGMIAGNAVAQLDHTALADELFSIRMRAYGLTKMDTTKVQQLGRLERMVAEVITFKGDAASYTGNIADAAQMYGPVFGIVDISTPEAGSFVVWFMYRFIPVYLAALTAAKRYTGKTDLLGGFLNLKQEHLLLTADAMIAATSQAGSVWKVPQSPWDKVEMNTDPKSCDVFLDNIKAKIKESLLPEKGASAVSNASPPMKSRSTSSAMGESLKKAADTAIADVPSMRDQLAGDTSGMAPAINTEGERPVTIGGMDGTIPANAGGGGTMASGGLATGENGMQWLTFSKGVDLEGTNPEFKKNLLAMAEEFGAVTGKKLPVTDAHRSTQEQAKLHATMPKGRAAAPGTSLHEFGLAIDADSATLNTLDKMGLMKKYGFTRPVGAEPWHVEPAGIQGNLNQAKRDPVAAQQAVQASLGAGGGGYGTVSGARKYGRNPAMAATLFNDKAPIGTGESPVAKAEPAANLPSVPSASTAGMMNASMRTPANPVASGNAESAPKTTSSGTSKMSDGWGGNTGYIGGVNKLRTTAVNPTSLGTGSTASTEGTGQYASIPDVRGSDSSWMSYKDLITAAARVTGAPVKTLAAKAAVESGFRGGVKSGNSSASGLFQFMPATWKEMMGKYAAKYGIPVGAQPTDAKANAILAGLYYKEIEKSSGGSSKNFGPVEAYVGHLLGPDGGKRFLKGLQDSPDALVSTVVSGDSLRGNAPYFTRDGRVLTIKESYDQIASNYQKKYAAFGVERDLGPLDGTVVTSNASAPVADSGKPMRSGSGGTVSAMNTPTSPSPGYTASTRPTASTSDAYNAGRRTTESDSSVSPISAMAIDAGRNAFGGAAPSQTMPSSPMGDTSAVVKNTADLLNVAKDQVGLLTQMRDLLQSIVGTAAKAAPPSAAPEAPANATFGFKPRPASRTVSPSISMARSI